MARRKTPARDSKGRFIKGRRNTTRRKTTRKRSARRNGTRAGQRRVTARRAYRKAAPNRRRSTAARRRARRNATQKQLMSVIGWASGWAWASAYLRRYLSGFFNSPIAGNYGTVATGVAIGLYMSKKARRAPAGYAILGVSLSVLAESLGNNLGIMPPAPESGSGFVPRKMVYRPPPRRMNIAPQNPIRNIVVPS